MTASSNEKPAVNAVDPLDDAIFACTEMMDALVCHGVRDYKIEQVPRPRPEGVDAEIYKKAYYGGANANNAFEGEFLKRQKGAISGLNDEATLNSSVPRIIASSGWAPEQRNSGLGSISGAALDGGDDFSIVIKVLAVGVCAGDSKCFAGAPHFWSPGEYGKSYCQPPVIPGHEFMGEIVEMGRGFEVARKHREAAAKANSVGGEKEINPGAGGNYRYAFALEQNPAQNLRIGDWITADQIVPCQSCAYCVDPNEPSSAENGPGPADSGKDASKLSKSYNMCLPHDIFGFRQSTPGAMAQYMRIPTRSFLTGCVYGPLPKSMKPTHLAYVEPLSCAVHAAERGDSTRQLLERDARERGAPTGYKNVDWENDVCVVSGCGPIGLGIVAAIRRYRKPKLLIALDLFDWKLDIAKQCGADMILNPKNFRAPNAPPEPETETLVQRIKSLTGKLGCQKYFEATGHPASVCQGLDMIARKGVFVEYAVFGMKTTADWTVISDAKEIEIKGGHLSPFTYKKAIEMICCKAPDRDGAALQSSPESESFDALPLDKIVSHELEGGLADWNRAFDLVEKSAESVKVVMTMC